MSAFPFAVFTHSRLAMAVLWLALVVAVLSACGSGSNPEAFMWMNPTVEDRCNAMHQVLEQERPGGSVPPGFPLPSGASIVGSAAGAPITVHVTAPGDFLHLDSFFKTELEDQSWAGDSSGNGSDPSGRYGYVLVDGHGWHGEVVVVQCGDDDPVILINVDRKRAPQAT